MTLFCPYTDRMTPILQSHLPAESIALLHKSSLPGIRPLAMADWLQFDDAFGGQMAERDRLLGKIPEQVHAMCAEALAAGQELLDCVLAVLKVRAGYRVTLQYVTRPDGIDVLLDRDAPLLTLGRLVQEDFCLLQKQGDEHVMTGAILCFPASWTLAEKFMRPLVRIHKTVGAYDAGIAKRVQRLFDGVLADRPLWRANGLLYADATLHAPRREADPREKIHMIPRYFRSERHSILRLPESRAVVFSIHTYVVALEEIPAEDRGKLGLNIYS